MPLSDLGLWASIGCIFTLQSPTAGSPILSYEPECARSGREGGDPNNIWRLIRFGDTDPLRWLTTSHRSENISPWSPMLTTKWLTTTINLGRIRWQGLKTAERHAECSHLDDLWTVSEPNLVRGTKQRPNITFCKTNNGFTFTIMTPGVVSCDHTYFLYSVISSSLYEKTKFDGLFNLNLI